MMQTKQLGWAFFSEPNRCWLSSGHYGDMYRIQVDDAGMFAYALEVSTEGANHNFKYYSLGTHPTLVDAKERALSHYRGDECLT